MYDDCVQSNAISFFSAYSGGSISLCRSYSLLVFDNDWASLWSWLTSCACFVSLIEPWLFRTSRVMDAEALAPEGQALRRNIFFRMAWHRFIVFKWAPWLDEGVNMTEERGDLKHDDCSS